MKTNFQVVLEEGVCPKKSNRVFYKCELPDHPVFALSDDDIITTGLTLLPYFSEEFDFVEEDVSILGTEATVIIPEGMQDGDVYEALMTNIGRDWETGCIDSYDITFVKIVDSEELARIESKREYFQAMED